MTRTDEPQKQAQRFADEAGRPRQSTVGELWHFLRHNKKWWLAPIVVMLLLVGVLVILGGTVLAPLIYPLI
jgi:hypothetical protein